MDNLLVTSPSFKNGGEIPLINTGYAEDISPELNLSNLSKETVSLAVIMDDLGIPFVKEYNHWVIFNLPVSKKITVNIPHGEVLKDLGGAIQGVGYGKHCYRGPKIPPVFKKPHTYRFTVFALDIKLDLTSKATKKDLLKAIEGHIIQKGSLECFCNVHKHLKQ